MQCHKLTKLSLSLLSSLDPSSQKAPLTLITRTESLCHDIMDVYGVQIGDWTIDIEQLLIDEGRPDKGKTMDYSAPWSN